MTTFVKRLLFDDERLRERTLTDLVRAFETGRMVAFVGSMATEAQGYGSWEDLIRKYTAAAVKIAGLKGHPPPIGNVRQDIVQGAKKVSRYRRRQKIIDMRVALSLARDALGRLDEIDPLPRADDRDFDVGTSTAAESRDSLATAADALVARGLKELWETLGRLSEEIEDLGSLSGLTRVQLLDHYAARLFRRPRGPAPDRDASVARALFRDLRVHRFATLNYDLEIEAELMVEPGEREEGGDPIRRLEMLRRSGVIRSDPEVPTRFSRLLADGTYVESDIRARDRPDRLIDFAVGSAIVDRRIMHLHGRATNPQTMIVGLRDYDRLYRKADPARVPFDHGQRILFAGNPLLFVGTGMSEQEVTWTLQDFVSNNPYRRFAPTFLLWGTSSFSAGDMPRASQKWLKRIDFFRRFGVLTVFDEDLAPPTAVGWACKSYAAKDRDWKKFAKLLASGRGEKRPNERRWVEQDLLAKTVPLLAKACVAHQTALRDWGSKDWRKLTERLESPGAPDPSALPRTKLITLWETPEICSEIDVDLARLFDPRRGAGLPFRAVVASSGSGKGVLAWKVAESKLHRDFDAPFERRLVVNAGYALDSDFLLRAVSKFILNFKAPARAPGKEPRVSRETQFAAADAFDLAGFVRKKALIIINGLERFFTVDGAPLSAELDQLLRRIARGPAGDIRWLFLGSTRIKRYFETLSAPAVVPFADVCRSMIKLDGDEQAAAAGSLSAANGPVIWHRDQESQPAESVKPRVRSVYFSYVIRRMEAIVASAAKAGKPPGRSAAKAGKPPRSATFGDLVVVDAHKGGSARAIARVVVDAYVTVNTICGVCEQHPALAMEILRALAFIGNPVEAAVLLHVPRIRNVLRRDSGDRADLLTGTVKKLMAAGLVIKFDALNGYPKDKRGLWYRYGLHTAVAGELRKRVGVPLSESKLSTSFNMSLFVAQPVDAFIPDTAIHDELDLLIQHLTGAYKDSKEGEPDGHPRADARRAGPHATAAMRAALALIRSYYSTTSLLALECDQRPLSEDRDGVLLEHAERLETLLGAFRKLRRARAAARRGAPRGPEPFFADDLVWILNELGVVYLAQGDLYSARRSFDDAMRVNRESVEYECRSHNWRRITMNRVLLDIERAELGSADEKLYEIEAAIDARDRDRSVRTPSRFTAIRRRFGERGAEERSCFHAEIMHEEVLMTGLVLGHRAFGHHLRGHLRTAAPLYRDATAILRRLGEHRAYAMFQRLYAQLLNLTDRAESKVAVALAVTASESVRQIDMAYHARIVAAHESWQSHPSDAEVRRKAVNQLTRALAYAATMDLYRLRVEAGLYLARLKRDSGDYESALDHAADALAVAARYGLSLRKISLRIEIGHILVRRGHPKSGGALIAHAGEVADRFGYQRAVEAVQQIGLEEGLAV